MGFAKAAELNGYPGPRHVIDLADQLALSDDQLRGTRRLFDSMQEQAIDLGRQVIDAERHLDELFLTRKAGAALRIACSRCPLFAVPNEPGCVGNVTVSPAENNRR